MPVLHPDSTPSERKQGRNPMNINKLTIITMNSKNLLLGFGGLLVAIGLAWGVTSCGKKGRNFTNDPAEDSFTYLKAEHKIDSTDLETDTLLLYVDYSTCVAEAMNSAFFQEVQPTIISNKPLYFSIKGNDIKQEEGDTYQLLRGVKEVNNADLKTAAEQIAGQNHQAVLITDAEYWHPNVGDNLNNPYMKGALSKWLAAGRDIYIYAEPYVESGKFNKNRYYIVFTDDRMEPDKNINKKLQKGISSLGEVKKLHLTARAPKVDMTAEMMKDEEGNTLFDKDASRDKFRQGVPMYVFETNINDIAKSLKGAGENRKGDPEDLPLIAGIELPTDDSGIFNINGFDVKVYDLTPQAVDFTTPEEDEEGNPVVKTAEWNPVLLDDVLEIGEKELKNGQLALYFDDDFIEDGDLEGVQLLLVQIVADKAESQFDKDSDAYKILTWESISKAAKGGSNNSFFESVKQAVINDKSINPAAQGRNVVASFYLVTQ